MNNKKQFPEIPAGLLRLALRLGLAAGALCSGQAAHAATATGVMTVTATVASTCIVGASTLAFGSATSAAIQAGNIDATGTVTVNCTTGSAYTVALDKGAGTGATIPIRKMTSGANLLNYSVYVEAGRTTVWGDATGTTVAGTGTGAAQSISAYGRIFSGQTVPAASYTDTVNVTVTY
jgi:spore coat protein U-like protein